MYIHSIKRRLEIAKAYDREDNPLAAIQVMWSGRCDDLSKLTDEEALRWAVEHPHDEDCEVCPAFRQLRSDLL